jgi:hypothetical protein
LITSKDVRVRWNPGAQPEIPCPPLTGLPPHAFLRLDEAPDAEFCAKPRFVVHIDAAAIAAVTRCGAWSRVTQIYNKYLI